MGTFQQSQDDSVQVMRKIHPNKRAFFTLLVSISSFASFKKRLDETLSSRAFWRASSNAAAMSSDLGCCCASDPSFLSSWGSETMISAAESTQESVRSSTCQTG